MSQAPAPTIDCQGHCDCGATTLHANGRSISMFQCACQNCQRATGTGHSSILLMRTADLTISGTLSTYARTADSGAQFTRNFCPNCGTTLFATSSRAQGLTIIPVGIFAQAATWFAPKHVIFGARHHEWDQFAPNLPIHATYPAST